MSLPYPTGTNVTELFTYPTILLDEFGVGYLWGLIIIILTWIILTVSIYEFRRVSRIEEATAASSFITTIIGVLLAPLIGLPPLVIMFPLLMTGISAAALYINRN